jgi:carbon storage regulator
MLVLSRNKDQRIMIGDDVVLTIVDIKGDKVRLGIDAPKDIPVHRQEVYDQIKNQTTFNEYLSSGDGNSAYSMLIDRVYKADNDDLDNLSNVMGVSVGALEASLEYKI